MIEIDETFASMNEWALWLRQHPEVHNPETANEIGSQIQKLGLQEPLTGRIFLTHEIFSGAPNWREGLVAAGLNSRMRALLYLLNEKISTIEQPKIFSAEGITPLALRLRGLFPYFIGSEWLPDQECKATHFPVPHEDLTQLSYPTSSFDAVVTNDVLEHVPNLDAALRELARVLKTGGWHISTHPFRMMHEDSLVKAAIVDNCLVNLTEPEYHDNPTDPSGGSLVFEVPGWDIIERTRDAGFSEVHMRFISSQKFGILTQQLGVFVLCSKK